MKIVKKLFSALSRGSQRRATHAVLVHLPFEASAADAAESEADAMYRLGSECEEAVALAGAGQFEGEEFDEAACILVFSGPDADLLWSAVSPIVRASHLSRGAHAILRYGDEGARQAKLAI